MTMKRRKIEDTQPMAPKRDDRRLRVRREVLRNLNVTELNGVLGGMGGVAIRTTCGFSIIKPP
jgi:hypothetical protein